MCNVISAVVCGPEISSSACVQQQKYMYSVDWLVIKSDIHVLYASRIMALTPLNSAITDTIAWSKSWNGWVRGYMQQTQATVKVKYENYLQGVGDPGTRLMFKFRSGTNGLNEELGRHRGKNGDRQCRLWGMNVRVWYMCSGSVLYMIALEKLSWE